MTPDMFRHLAGHFATGVTIITTLDANGNPCGMTANSFASVSLDPPLISIAVDHSATIFSAMLASRGFTVNILDASQEALSRRFAAGLDDRFEGVPWQRESDDQVIIAGTLAHLCCNKWAEIPAGDHTIFIGRVVDGGADEHRTPLVHYRGEYRE
jgi:3-hydroxy-9,10-secoandrosta-1,3,5(10)-triene-9,17-dione monooxygenase reductase component